MSLRHLVVPPLRTTFIPVSVPTALPRPAPTRPVTDPGQAPGTALGASAEWNATHGRRMAAVQWLAGGAVMAYFLAGLLGTLGVF